MADTTNAQKYKGYDLDRNSSHRRRRNQPWFWKVLGISLLLTIIILAGVVFGVLHKTHKNAKHMEEINAANNIEALLKDHKNVTITTSYSHLAEGSDYTTTRQVRKDKKGNYFSYFKKEGTDADYKEVIANKELYRYNDKYVQYYGLIGDDYEQECVKGIEDSVFQGDTKDQLQNEKERDNTITLQLTTKVQASDEYATTYGFSAGDTIEKTITMDKKTQIITPTLLGEMIYEVVAGSIRPLLDPRLTASWEKGLTLVANGEISGDEYMVKLDDFVTRRTNAVKQMNNQSALYQRFQYAAQFYKK